MSYVGQLEQVPSTTFAAERRALSLATQGPGDSWRRHQHFDDLFALKQCWGLPHSFRRLELQTWAIQLRVAYCENWRAAGGDWRPRARAFSLLRGNTLLPQRAAAWADWYDAHPLLVLERAVDRFEAMHGPLDAVWTHLVTGSTAEDPIA